MKRFDLQELSISRLRAAFERRILDIPHSIAWSFSKELASRNRAGLEKFRNKHMGKRCFIVGNGPSLQKTDLSKLENEFTFGLNRIYLLFQKTRFRPTYYVCVNELVLEQFAKDIQSLSMPKFLNWNRRSYYSLDAPLTYFVRLSLGLRDTFGVDLTHSLCGGGTVTYVALQLAYYMGFSEVILVGVDHNFTDKGIPNTTEVRKSEQDANHFSPDYFPKGVRWQLPDLLRSEMAYTLAREAFTRSGRRVYDATIDGKCPVFDKKDFEKLFP